MYVKFLYHVVFVIQVERPVRMYYVARCQLLNTIEVETVGTSLSFV